MIIGAIIFVIIYVISGLILKILELIGKVFASTPVSVIVGLAAIAVGVVLIAIHSGLLSPDVLGIDPLLW